MKSFFILLLITFAGMSNLHACSIFFAAKNAEVLAAGNEDWSDPFNKLWTKPATDDSFGMLLLGHSDFQVQAGINQYGLFFDFAVIPTAQGKNMRDKEKFNGDLFVEVLSKCKNVEEALAFFKIYAYPSAVHQALIGDASGASALLNQDAIIRNTQYYQISTNFNSCNIATGAYDCKRYSILDEGLSATDSISIPFFRRLLSRTHQEGEYPTQYSYIFDLKRLELHLYSFHNYEDVLILDLKTEISQKSYVKDLKSMFPKSFEELYFRTNHKDSLKQALVNIIKEKNTQYAIKAYEKYTTKFPETAAYPFLLWDVGAHMIQEGWVRDSAGHPFSYWWYPEQYYTWRSNHPHIRKALELFNYLENVPKEDERQQIGAYEMKGLIFLVLDDIKKSKTYLEKTLKVATPETGNYRRAEQLLSLIITTD